MKSYSWVMFDADNTLFDFDEAEQQALAMTFDRLDLPFLAEYKSLYHRINAEIWSEFEQGQISSAALRVERFVRLFRAVGLGVDAESFSRVYLVFLAQGAQLLPGAQEIIAALRDAGLRLALVTNGLRDVQRPRLKASALAGCFEAVIISEEVGVPKPEAGFFEAAFAQMGHPARSVVLLVGDSLSSDIRGGNLYGLDTCWYNPAGRPADPRCPATFTISRLEQLAEIVNLNNRYCE
jgi:2-haloacid dehalogenase